MMKELSFNYEMETVSNLSVPALLEWISDLHGEMADNGTWSQLSTESHLQLMTLSGAAEKIKRRSVPRSRAAALRVRAVKPG